MEDLRRATQGDEQLLEQILSNTISTKEKTSRLEEALAIFPDLPRATVEEALQSNQWDVDLAIVALIAKAEEQAQVARLSREEEKRQRYINVEQMAMARLRGYLNAEAKVKLQELLEANEGDIDETITEFFQYIDNTREEEEKHRRSCILHAVEESAPENVTREEIIQVLERSKWDRSEAARAILTLSEQRKIQQLLAMCKHAHVNITTDRCEFALAEHNWDVLAAREALLRVAEDDLPEEPHPAAEDFLARSMRFISKIDTEISKEKQNNSPHERVKQNLDHLLRNDPAAIGLVRVPGAVPVFKPQSRQPPPVESLLESSSSRIENSRLNEERPMLESEVDNSAGDDNGEQDGVELTLSSDLLDNSETLSVKWAFTDSSITPSNRDWIGFYKHDQKDQRSYLTYQWVVPSNNTVEFSLRRFEYGTYNCRYHSAASKTCLSVSKSFSIGPVFTLTPILANNTGESSSSTNQVVLKIEQKSGDAPASGAWVGLYYLDPSQESPRNQSYLTYQRLSSAKDNTLIFDVPKSGVWEFRLFPLNTYQHAASCHIDIQGTDTLTLRVETSLPVPQIFIDVDLQTKDVANDAPWIGVYKTCEVNPRMYRRYKYLPTNGKSVIQFKAPIHAGAYEARLFAGGTYDVLAKSNPISLDGI